MKAFEIENALRFDTLKWRKCGYCSIHNKVIENFCCKEKSLEYDEYDALLLQAEEAGNQCITCLPEFTEHMLSK